LIDGLDCPNKEQQHQRTYTAEPIDTLNYSIITHKYNDTMMFRNLGLLFLAATTAVQAQDDASSSIAAATPASTVYINEIADKGTSEVCNGEDWVELYNPASATVDLGAEGYVLHDDKGVDSDERFAFPGGTEIKAESYLLLCMKQKLPQPDGADDSTVPEQDDPMSPQFGIGGEDVITLTRIRETATASSSSSSNTSSSSGANFQVQYSRNGEMYEIVSKVALPNTDDYYDVTYSLVDKTKDLYQYTGTPTPGAANVISQVLTLEERNELWKQELTQQNALATKFFNMDDRGYPLADGSGMDVVLDLNFTMAPEDYEYMVVNKTFEEYRPYQSATLYTVDGKEIVKLEEGGKIRTKGQSSLWMAACVGTETFPFQVNIGVKGGNETLFGMERIYLRSHIGDFSYMRDYAYNRYVQYKYCMIIIVWFQFVVGRLPATVLGFRVHALDCCCKLVLIIVNLPFCAYPTECWHDLACPMCVHAKYGLPSTINCMDSTPYWRHPIKTTSLTETSPTLIPSDMPCIRLSPLLWIVELIPPKKLPLPKHASTKRPHHPMPLSGGITNPKWRNWVSFNSMHALPVITRTCGSETTQTLSLPTSAMEVTVPICCSRPD